MRIWCEIKRSENIITHSTSRPISFHENLKLAVALSFGQGNLDDAFSESTSRVGSRRTSVFRIAHCTKLVLPFDVLSILILPLRKRSLRRLLFPSANILIKARRTSRTFDCILRLFSPICWHPGAEGQWNFDYVQADWGFITTPRPGRQI